jgi:hypothetical protein
MAAASANSALSKLPGAGKIQQDAVEVDQFSQRLHGAVSNTDWSN